MFKALRLRFIFIFFILFMGLFWNFYKGEMRSEVQTGICKNFDYKNWKCDSGYNLRSENFFLSILDPASAMVVFGLTFLGSWFRQGNLANKIERASHVAKNCGELGATIGAVISFSGVFFEPSLHTTFKYVFMAYLYGQILGYILTVISNHIRSMEESAIGPVHYGSIAP